MRPLPIRQNDPGPISRAGVASLAAHGAGKGGNPAVPVQWARLEGPWRNPCVPGIQCGRPATATPERPSAVCHVGVAVGPAVAAPVSPASGSSISSHHPAKPVSLTGRHPTAAGTRAAAAMTPASGTVASGTAASWPITELWEPRRESRIVPLPREPGHPARRHGRSSRRLPGGSGHSFTIRTRWKSSIHSMMQRRAQWKNSAWARI